MQSKPLFLPDKRPHLPPLINPHLSHTTGTSATTQHTLPLKPRTGTTPGIHHLHLSIQPIPRTIHTIKTSNTQTHSQQIIHLNRINPRNSKPRKPLKPARHRNVLIAKSSKPMISRHEKILPRNPSLTIKRRTMRLHLLSITIPHQLHIMHQTPPSCQRPTMHSQMLQLRSSPRILRTALASQTHLTILMNCRNPTGRPINITNQYIRKRLYHIM